MGAEPVRMDGRSCTIACSAPAATCRTWRPTRWRPRWVQLAPDVIEGLRRLPTLQPARHDARRRVEPGDVARHLPRQPRRGAAADRGAGELREELRAAVAAGDAERIEKLLVAGKAGRDRVVGGIDPRVRWLLMLARAGAAAPSTTSRRAVKARGPRHRRPTTAICGTSCRATSSALIDVDLAALRASPWSHALMRGRTLDGDREERRRRFGYDVFTEAERMIVAGAESTGGPEHADRRARPLRRRARRQRVPRRDAGRGGDAVARERAVGGAGARRSRWSRRGRWSRATASACGRHRRGLGDRPRRGGRRRSASCGDRSTPTGTRRR